MFTIAEAEISGDQAHVAQIKKVFGLVTYRGSIMENQPALTLTCVLPNYYKASDGKNPLYVLVPDKNVECVWPGTWFEVKYGTAQDQNTKAIITGAVAVFKDLAGIYLCLTPNGKLITEIGAPGHLNLCQS